MKTVRQTFINLSISTKVSIIIIYDIEHHIKINNLEYNINMNTFSITSKWTKFNTTSRAKHSAQYWDHQQMPNTTSRITTVSPHLQQCQDRQYKVHHQDQKHSAQYWVQQQIPKTTSIATIISPIPMFRVKTI